MGPLVFERHEGVHEAAMDSGVTTNKYRYFEGTRIRLIIVFA